MDKLVLGWLLGVPVLMLIVLQYLMCATPCERLTPGGRINPAAPIKP